jgi:hypothetical protein
MRPGSLLVYIASQGLDYSEVGAERYLDPLPILDIGNLGTRPSTIDSTELRRYAAMDAAICTAKMPRALKAVDERRDGAIGGLFYKAAPLGRSFFSPEEA